MRKQIECVSMKRTVCTPSEVAKLVASLNDDEELLVDLHHVWASGVISAGAWYSPLNEIVEAIRVEEIAVRWQVDQWSHRTVIFWKEREENG